MSDENTLPTVSLLANLKRPVGAAADELRAAIEKAELLHAQLEEIADDLEAAEIYLFDRRKK